MTRNLVNLGVQVVNWCKWYPSLCKCTGASSSTSGITKITCHLDPHEVTKITKMTKLTKLTRHIRGSRFPAQCSSSRRCSSSKDDNI